MEKQNKPKKSHKRTLIRSTTFVLSMLMVLTSFTMRISANDDEVHANDDMSIVVKIDRTVNQDKKEVKLDLTVSNEESIKIDDVRVDEQSIKNDDFLYSYAVGKNGEYKFTVVSTRIEKIEQENEEIKEVEHKDFFVFCVKVNELENTETTKITGDVKTEQAETEKEDLLPVEQEAEQHETDEVQTPRKLDRIPNKEELDLMLKKDEFIFVNSRTGEITIEKHTEETKRSRVKRSSDVITHGEKIIDSVTVTWRANRSYTWTMWGGVSQIRVNGEIGFCLEPSVLNVETSSAFGTALTEIGLIRVHPNGSLTFNLTFEQRDRIELISNYVKLRINQASTQAEAKRYEATGVVMIWDTVGWDVSTPNQNFNAEIADINNLISDHEDRPSWHGELRNVKIGEIVDLSNPLNPMFVVDEYTGLEIVEDSGTTLKVRITDKNASLTMAKKAGSEKGTSYVFSDGSSQKVGLLRLNDPTYTGIRFEAPSGNLGITKLGTDGKAYAGVTFDLSKDKSIILNTVATGTNGTANIADLEAGTYFIREVSGPENLVIDTNWYPVTIVAGETTNYTATNDIKPSLLVGKQDTNGKWIPNTEFEYSYNKQDILGKLKTGADGKAPVVKNLTAGTIYVRETHVDKPLVVNTEWKAVTLKNNETTTYIAVNEIAKWQYTLIKQDPYGNPLSVTFATYNDQGVYLGDVTTGADGIYTSPKLDFSTIKFVEKSVPTGVVLDKTEFTLTGSYKDQHTALVLVSKTVLNTYQRGNQKLIKVEDNWDTSFPEYNGQVIANVEIGAYAVNDIYEGSKLIVKKDQLIQKGFTNAKGEIVFNDLSIGSYYAKELSGPNNYQPYDGKWFFDITYDAQNPSKEVIEMTKTVTNQTKFGKTAIIKTGHEGLVFLKDAHFGLYRASDDKLIFDGYTNVFGFLMSPDVRVDEELYWKEIKAPSGYITSDRKYPVTITEHGETIYIPAVNEMAKVKLRIFKPNSETQEPLADAHFRILNTDTNEWVVIKIQQGNNVVEISEWVTDETGYFTMEEYLLAGNYRLIETIAPEGFNIADTIDFVVDENTKVVELEVIGKVLEMTVENRPIRSDIAVAKVSKETGERLPNFPMRLTSLSDMSTIELLTNEEGIALFEKTLFGVHMVEEIGVDGEYIIDRTPQFINITEDGIVYEVTFENSKPTGTVEYTKTDEDTGEAVSGAMYRVWNDEGTFDQEIETDENGKWVLTGLPLSDNYHYQEMLAPYGYIIDETIYDFEIKYIDMDTAVITKDFEGTNKHFKGEFNGLKLDEDTKEALQGAIFEFTLPDGSTIRVESDENGEFGLKDLMPGHYTYKEVLAPTGYVLDNTVYEFDIEYKDQHTPVVTVSHERTNHANQTIIYKFDNKTGDPLIAEFDVVRVDDKGNRELILSLRTDKENGGKVVIDKLPDGNYKVIEKWVEEPYVINPDNKEQDLIITPTEAKYSVIFKNEKAVGEYDITKLDAKTNAPISNVTYGLYDITDIVLEENETLSYEALQALKPYETSLTDIDGRLVFKGLDIERKWAVIELEAPYGYIIDETVRLVEFEYVDNNTPVISNEVTLLNERLQVAIQGVKIDSITKSQIASQHFDLVLKDKDGNIIPLDHKDEDGVHYWVVDALEVYFMSEEKAPEGYLLSDEIKEIHTTEETEGNLYIIEYENTPRPLDVIPSTGIADSMTSTALLLMGLGITVTTVANRKRRKEEEAI